MFQHIEIYFRIHYYFLSKSQVNFFHAVIRKTCVFTYGEYFKKVKLRGGKSFQSYLHNLYKKFWSSNPS